MTLSWRKKYQPEGFEVLNVSHGGVKATCPGDVDVEAFSQAYSNLGIEKHTTVGGERRRGTKQKGGGNKHMGALEINIKHSVKSSQLCLTASSLGYALVLRWFLVLWDKRVIWGNLKQQQRTRKLGVITQCNYLRDASKSRALKK